MKKAILYFPVLLLISLSTINALEGGISNNNSSCYRNTTLLANAPRMRQLLE